MSIFQTSNLSPNEFVPFLTHFDEFDQVFIAFMPFIKLNDSSKKDKRAYCQISYQQAVNELPLIEKIGKNSQTIWGLNGDYPTDEIIRTTGEPYRWQTIIANTQLSDFSTLNKALLTQLGRLRIELEQPNLAKILNDFINREQNLWYPAEGQFDVLSLITIYELLKKKDIHLITMEDEFYDEKLTLNLNDVNCAEFIDIVDERNFKYIYSYHHSILFSIYWDNCFFSIAIKNATFSKQDIEKNFEGFWASATDTLLWTWTEAEIQALPIN